MFDVKCQTCGALAIPIYITTLWLFREHAIGIQKIIIGKNEREYSETALDAKRTLNSTFIIVYANSFQFGYRSLCMWTRVIEKRTPMKEASVHCTFTEFSGMIEAIFVRNGLSLSLTDWKNLFRLQIFL